MLDRLEMWRMWRVTWLITVCHEAAFAMISSWLVDFAFLFSLLPFLYLSFLFVLRYVCIIAKIAYYLCDVHLRVHVSSCISLALIGWISMKFDIEDFNENLSRFSKYGWNLAKVMGTSRDYRSTFICCWQHYVAVRCFLQKKVYQAVMVMRYKHCIMLHCMCHNVMLYIHCRSCFFFLLIFLPNGMIVNVTRPYLVPYFFYGRV